MQVPPLDEEDRPTGTTEEPTGTTSEELADGSALTADGSAEQASREQELEEKLEAERRKVEQLLSQKERFERREDDEWSTAHRQANPPADPYLTRVNEIDQEMYARAQQGDPNAQGYLVARAEQVRIDAKISISEIEDKSLRAATRSAWESGNFRTIDAAREAAEGRLLKAERESFEKERARITQEGEAQKRIQESREAGVLSTSTRSLSAMDTKDKTIALSKHKQIMDRLTDEQRSERIRKVDHGEIVSDFSK